MCRTESLSNKNQSGFTLIELLVVIAIVGILATLAAPSVIQFARRSAMQSLSNDFTGGMQKARSEAVARNTCVSICKSANAGAAEPRCTTASDEWNIGWIAFTNTACDRTLGTSDPAAAGDIIFVRQPGDPRYTLVVSPSGRDSFTFGPQGGTGLATGRLSLMDSQDNNNPMNRVICVDSMGRTRIITDGGVCS